MEDPKNLFENLPQKLFYFNGKLTRLEYFLYVLCVNVAIFFLLLLAGALTLLSPLLGYLFLFPMILGFLIICYINLVVIVKRVKDMGWKRCLLLYVLSIVSIDFIVNIIYLDIFLSDPLRQIGVGLFVACLYAPFLIPIFCLLAPSKRQN